MKAILLILFFSVTAITKNAVHDKYANASKYNPPIMLEMERFKTEVICLGNFKKIIENLKKDTSLEIYRYFFTINKNGKVEPKANYHGSDTLFNSLNNYMHEVFNNYHWKAGSLKKCRTCKADISMELRIYFRTDINQIHLELKMIESKSETMLYFRKIKYKDFISIDNRGNCLCCSSKSKGS